MVVEVKLLDVKTLMIEGSSVESQLIGKSSDRSALRHFAFEFEITVSTPMVKLSITIETLQTTKG